jgi:ACS family hexuronate transporter-like MFS transporter
MMPAGRPRWILCWLLFGASALSFLDRQVLSVLAPALTAEFGMSNTDYSRVVTAFVLSYTIMFTLGGRMMDRIGTKLGMALAVGLWSIASGAHALVYGAMGLGIARFFLGIGEGACFPGVTKGAVEWFPMEQRVLAIGIANGGSSFGAALAPPLTSWVTSLFGWRGAFLATGTLGMIWVGAWLGVCRRFSTERSLSPAACAIPIASLLRRPDVWRVLGARSVFDPVFYFFMFWIPQYLARERGFSLKQIGAWFWMPFLALGISNILSGRLSDALVARGWAPLKARAVLLTVAAFGMTAIWLTPAAPSEKWAIAVMSAVMAAHGLWITNFLGLLSDRFPANAIATVTGLTGTAGGLMGALTGLCIGPIVDRYGFRPLFLAAGVAYLFALLLLPLRRPEL